MKIAFEKVGSSPKPFSLESSGVILEGTLSKETHHTVRLDAHLKGVMALDCDRCGEGYHHPLDETLKLQITDTIPQDKEDLDIIEFLDGTIDIEAILESETNALIGDYHVCPRCSEQD